MLSRLYVAVMCTSCLSLPLFVQSQSFFTGKVVDSVTGEPVAGAALHCQMSGCRCGCIADASGIFSVRCHCAVPCVQFVAGAVGYQSANINSAQKILYLVPRSNPLEQVVVTANRGAAAKRSDAPVAISAISNKMMQEAKATTADQLLNKVSGVHMVDLGNEQHQMSIRQPMTTKALFLYLEDGIPIRTTGLFNHNALLEMNMTATKSIEVIKGPSSSLYGSEAIGGVVNFISVAPTAAPALKASLQLNNIGYKKADMLAAVTRGKLGVVISGYYAAKEHGYLEYSDFNKGVITARANYHLSAHASVSSSITWMHYYSDMSGAIDSAMFASKTFSNQQTFTYRKVDALRYHTTLTQQWNQNGRSTITVLYRDNTIGQNPAYRIKDDYRKAGNTYIGQKDLAHGEINASRFHSYAVTAQHRQQFRWIKAVVLAGFSVELNPSSYTADYIRIKKDTSSKKYVQYANTDSILTNYATRLNNFAGFLNFECSPLKKLRLVASLRYDVFNYRFTNHLTPSAFSGAPDTANVFSRINPKIGFTYNISHRLGWYANYSEGFVPPQVTELYTGVKVPSLNSSAFYNTEAGGWFEMIPKTLSADLSIYQLRGTNEIISVKLDDGSYANQNAGRTLHYGLELGVNATPVKNISLRFSGAYSQHRFIEYVEKGISYTGKEMNNAPHFVCNAEAWYRPACIKGFRCGIEWQHVGKYFADPQNTAVYKGYDVFALRTACQFGGVEVWMHVMNATNRYYATIATKSSYGYSYQVAEPINFNAGISVNVATLAKWAPLKK